MGDQYIPPSAEHPLTAENLPDFIRHKWLESMNGTPSPEMIAAMQAQGATPSDYRDGSRAAGTMTDFYGVPISLPEGMTPEELLQQMRDDPNSRGRGGDEETEFSDSVGWPVAGPGGRQQHEIADLDIKGPDNGAIAYNDVDISDGQFSVNTVTDDASATHPVSGQRSWGYVPYGDGQYMFYNTGSDSHNLPGSDMLGQPMQHATWLAHAHMLQQQAAMLGGSSGDVVFDRQRQDAALMDRAPGTLTLDDIAQDDHLEGDELGNKALALMHEDAAAAHPYLDSALGMAEMATDAAGVGAGYVGRGLDWFGEETGLFDLGAPDWQFTTGEVFEALE